MIAIAAGVAHSVQSAVTDHHRRPPESPLRRPHFGFRSYEPHMHTGAPQSRTKSSVLTCRFSLLSSPAVRLVAARGPPRGAKGLSRVHDRDGDAGS